LHTMPLRVMRSVPPRGSGWGLELKLIEHERNTTRYREVVLTSCLAT